MACSHFSGCQTLDGQFQEGDKWLSGVNPCQVCHCGGDGAATCSQLSCPANECSASHSAALVAVVMSGLRNATRSHAADIVDECCPSCRSISSNMSGGGGSGGSSSSSINSIGLLNQKYGHAKCKHQEMPDKTYSSGQQWIYKCHTCECLVSFCTFSTIFYFSLNFV